MKEHIGAEAFNKMTEQELLQSAISLVTLMKAVYQPITKEEYGKFNEGEEKVNKAFDTLFTETERRSGKK